MKVTYVMPLFFAATLALTGCKSSEKAAQASAKELSAPAKKKPKFKPYAKVITKDAVSDDGLFDVHRVDDKYYYEIPNDVLKKDMLWVSRISQIPANLGGGYLNAGSKTNQQVVAWERFQDKILLKIKSYDEVALDTTAAINNSVKVNNYEPTMYAFDIEAFSKDSTATVIDVTKFLTTDVKAISGMPPFLRRQYKVRNLDGSRSFVNSIKSFPENVEVKQDMTYNAAEPPSNSAVGSISLQMNQSMILFRKNPCNQDFMILG